MPKFYVQTEEQRLIIDRKSEEEAAKYFVGLNPDLVYDAMKTGKSVFIHVTEKGFDGPWKTDSMFDVIELVHKMGPSG